MQSIEVTIAAVVATGLACAPSAAQVRSDADIKECLHGIEVAKRHHADPSLPGTGPDPVAHPLRTQCFRLRARAQDDEARRQYYATLKGIDDDLDRSERKAKMEVLEGQIDAARASMRARGP